MWIMLIISIVTLICSGFLFFYVIKEHDKNKQINSEVQKENQKIEKTNIELKSINKAIQEERDKILYEIQVLNKQQEKEELRLKEMRDSAQENIKAQEDLIKKSFEDKCNLLDQKYLQKKLQIDNDIEWLDNALKEHSDEIHNNMDTLDKKYQKEKAEIEEDLARIKATRAATIQAQIKEKEIEENSSFYCLTISEIDKADIKMLENIKPQLNKPRVLSMLIWSTFFQKPMTTLCNNIVGVTTVTGIYKITNQVTKECYIGQSVDIAKRWKDHAKCGLGIDTPAGNKLYKAIQVYGIWNFSWEILEQCPKDQLDEQEKYYIDLYDSYNFGYNSNAGIGRK